MQCALHHWFTCIRFALLCGGGGGRPTTAVLEQKPSSASLSHQNDDINGNKIQSDPIDEDLMDLLQQVASRNHFHKPMFEMTAATKAGDNYVGRVLRAVIHEAESSPERLLSVIFKLAPASKNRREALHSGSFFQNEAKMYQIVLPALNSFLKEYGLSKSDTYPGTARCLATKISDNPDDNAEDILVLEDMTPQGFVMLDRTAGLDFVACRFVLRRLAHLHATSFAFRHLRPNDAAEVESNIREVLFIPGNSTLDDLVTMAKSNLFYFEDQYPPSTVEYKKLENFVNHFVDVMMELVSPNELSCVLHGDCWVNNVLFKLNKDKQVEKACLIDFQLSRVASPVLDIAYCIFTSTTKETRDSHYQNLLKDYYSELSTTLTSLGCDVEEIIPWSVFQDQLKAYSRFGLGMALFVVPLILTDSSEAVDLDELMEQENATLTSMVNQNTKSKEKCKKRLNDVLQDCIELGYL